MSESPFESGSLLAERFRVVADRQRGSSRVLDAEDTLAAGADRVRLLLVQSSVSKAELEAALQRARRYVIGLTGFGELLAVVALQPDLLGVAYRVPEGSVHGEELEADPTAFAALIEAVARVLEPVHQQGIAHGGIVPEVLAQSGQGALVFGFGLAQALASLGIAAIPTPAADAKALAELRPRPPIPAVAEPAEAEAPPLPLPEVVPEVAPTVPPQPRPQLRSEPPPPSERARRTRRWLGPLVIGLGLLAMVGGVGTVFVIARRTAPPLAKTLPSALPPAVTAPPPPLLVPPALKSAPLPAEPAPHDELPPISPPVRTRAPQAHEGAPIPVTDGQPSWGPDTAPVTLTSFADLECPHTRALLPELVRIKVALGDELRWVFRHRPLSQHSRGIAAAELLAGVSIELGPGPFWKLVSELAAHGEEDPVELIASWLEQSGIGEAERKRLATLPAARDLVEADGTLGARLFVRSTPSVFVNGARIDGFQPEVALLASIERERRAGLFTLLSGSAPESVYVRRTERNLINLGEDPPERACVPERGSPLAGKPSAALTIVQFCAYESSYCQQADPILSALLARYPNDVRLLWKNFPISAEKDGRLAASVALAARKAGGDRAFWGVHHALLEGRAALDSAPLLKAAEKLGLDVQALLGAARSGTFDPELEQDIELGRKLSVNGVPTQFVNGQRREGMLTLAELVEIVKAETALAHRLKAGGHDSVTELVCTARGVRR